MNCKTILSGARDVQGAASALSGEQPSFGTGGPLRSGKSKSSSGTEAASSAWAAVLLGGFHRRSVRCRVPLPGKSRLGRPLPVAPQGASVGVNVSHGVTVPIRLRSTASTSQAPHYRREIGRLQHRLSRAGPNTWCITSPKATPEATPDEQRRREYPDGPADPDREAGRRTPDQTKLITCHQKFTLAGAW